MANGFLVARSQGGAPSFGRFPQPPGLGRDVQLFANILAIPELNERRRQQANMERALLSGLGIPEQQLQTLIPQPGFEPPGGVAGKVLSGVGKVGSILSTVLGAPIGAPRLQPGAVLQLANLQHSRALEKKRDERFERTFGLQEKRYDLAVQGAERAEEAEERQQRSERRLQQAMEDAREQARIDEERAQRTEQRHIETAQRVEQRLTLSQQARDLAEREFELAEKKFEARESASEKKARERDDRMGAAKALGLDLSDPQIGWYILTGERMPRQDKMLMIQRELEARKQGGSAYPVLFKGVTDQELREAWFSDKSTDLQRAIEYFDRQQREETRPGGGKLSDGFTFEPVTP